MEENFDEGFVDMQVDTRKWPALFPSAPSKECACASPVCPKEVVLIPA
jgi:hypothetical protein